jgi:chloride channel protein, CIC family
MKASSSSLLRLGFASLISGALIGVVGASFRYCLQGADAARNQLLQWAHHWPAWGWVAPVAATALAAALARFLVVRFCPIAAGSGIQRVEAVMRGEEAPANWRVIPVKFVGGVLAIGSGLALGREGPTVQMGAALATCCSQWLLRDEADRMVVTAAGAGAGLAVAFNAPIGASVFVLEELTRSVAPRLLIATLAAAAIAVAEMRAMLGNGADFSMLRYGFAPNYALAVYLALGALLGALGANYNATIVALLDLSDRINRARPMTIAVLVGLIVGLLAWFTPTLVGSGEMLTQAILFEKLGLSALAVALFSRFLIGPFSYASGTPGGLFAPLLLVGAACGGLFAGAINLLVPEHLVPGDCAVVGMAGFFTAVVRTPLTGIIIVAEMTGRADLALPLLVAALGAMILTTLLGSEPIYDTLRNRISPSSRR